MDNKNNNTINNNRKKNIEIIEQNNISLSNSNSENNNNNINNLDYLNPDKKVDYNKLNTKQVIKRGDNILDIDGKIITGMVKTVYKDVDIMKDTGGNLQEQNEKLDNIKENLKEIDYSLKRAKEQIGNMFKILSQDKCITCLIITILIIIVTIIILSACGGDKQKNFNVPHDVFISFNNTSNNNEKFLNSFGIIYFIIFYFLFLFI